MVVTATHQWLLVSLARLSCRCCLSACGDINHGSYRHHTETRYPVGLSVSLLSISLGGIASKGVLSGRIVLFVKIVCVDFVGIIDIF